MQRLNQSIIMLAHGILCIKSFSSAAIFVSNLSYFSGRPARRQAAREAGRQDERGQAPRRGREAGGREAGGCEEQPGRQAARCQTDGGALRQAASKAEAATHGLMRPAACVW